MKTCVFLFLLALSALCGEATAQNYHVYAVKGDVQLVNGRTRDSVKVRRLLTAEQTVSVPQDGLLMLLDKDNRRLHTINQPCTGPLKRLLNGDKSSVKVLTYRYFKYLWNRLNGEGRFSAATDYMQRTTSAYRGPDSLLVACDTLATLPVDSVEVKP